jgi:CRISPR-associated protein Cas2
VDVLIAYDIADTAGDGARRLRRIAEVCLTYGQRVQLSAFECRVSPTRLQRLIGELQDVIDPALDSVMIYRFPGAIAGCRQRLGTQAIRELDEPWIL